MILRKLFFEIKTSKYLLIFCFYFFHKLEILNLKIFRWQRVTDLVSFAPTVTQ